MVTVPPATLPASNALIGGPAGELPVGGTGKGGAGGGGGSGRGVARRGGGRVAGGGVAGDGACEPGAGVPASGAVPLLLVTKVTPPGSAPVSVIAIDALVGKPVVVTVNVPATPGANVVLFALVICGA